LGVHVDRWGFEEALWLLHHPQALVPIPVLNCWQGTYIPEQKVKLRHGDQLLVEGLPDNIRLNYIRCGLLAEPSQPSPSARPVLVGGQVVGVHCVHALHPLPPFPPARSAYLGEAFQAHLQSNELLHQVFQFQPAYEPEERLTPLEKRMFKSKSSGDVRDRTELRRRERSQMASYKHGSLADD
jgi:hypothetical protein